MKEIPLIADLKGSVGVLRFNRPDKRNALSAELLVELYLALKKWQEEDQARVVVITGAPDRAFSSGYDISAIPTDLSDEAAQLLKTENPLELALNAIRVFPYPVLAMINGYCFGAGLNLAVCCDFRIAADHIKVGMPPAKLGAVYHPEGLKQFIEVIGMAKTRELFLTGHTYQGPEIGKLGLFNDLVPAENLQARVDQMADEIARNAPLALKGMKMILNLFSDSCCLNEKDTALAETLVHQAFNSEDLKEGQMAFLEKRTPSFKGR